MTKVIRKLFNSQSRAHLDTTTYRERLASRNAGFIRQRDGPLPDKSGVPCEMGSMGEIRQRLPHIYGEKVAPDSQNSSHFHISASYFSV